MTIYTFGDSHSKFGFKYIPNICYNELGSRLCYTFGIKCFDVLNIKDYNVQNDDTVIFCFGEIDCRAHIYRFVNDNTSYETIINCIVAKYFESIKKNIQQFNSIKTIVYNVVPPSNVHFIHNNDEYYSKILVKEKNEIPWKGSNEDRKKYHVYFNKRLKDECIKNNFIFFDVYDKYCDKNGFLQRELSDYNVHINNPVFIHEFLIENNII